MQSDVLLEVIKDLTGMELLNFGVIPNASRYNFLSLKFR